MNPPRTFGRRKTPSTATGNPSTAKPAETPSAKPHRSTSSKLTGLLKVNYAKRDGRWNHEFISLVIGASFKEVCPELVSPEGHRVYPVMPAEGGEPNAMKFPNLVKKATKAGLGIAIFTQKDMEPDFVFKHGQLTPYLVNNALMPLSTRPNAPAGESTIEAGAPYIVSNPSPQVLPTATRDALLKWLSHCHGISGIGICLRMDGIGPDMVKTLGVDFGKKMPTEERMREVMLGICWYLPPDIAVGMYPDMKKSNYFPL